MQGAFVPDAFEVPTSFDGPGFHLDPLSPAHNQRDYQAWTASMGHIHVTPGEWDSWPRPMSLEENMRDLERHAREFRDREALTTVGHTATTRPGSTVSRVCSTHRPCGLDTPGGHQIHAR